MIPTRIVEKQTSNGRCLFCAYSGERFLFASRLYMMKDKHKMQDDSSDLAAAMWKRPGIDAKVTRIPGDLFEYSEPN